ncbi:hypothetical protein L6164_019002 [Bauhinia variegata]|uniref:Uncharacterized protein n=1 Tax=Bauhinia variegata TaxID=167791 RepID=A0ACB9NED2_BAUVA|nr:hypothetical protein L6164_019002 [Bauhinia variegata]
MRTPSFGRCKSSSEVCNYWREFELPEDFEMSSPHGFGSRGGREEPLRLSSIKSRIRRKFPWMRSKSWRTSSPSNIIVEDPVITAHNARRIIAKHERKRSNVQR